MVDTSKVIEVPKEHAEAVRRELHHQDLVDRSRKITKRGDSVLIPVRSPPSTDLARFEARVVYDVQVPTRLTPRSPREILRAELEKSAVPASAAPTRWERVGDIVRFRIPPGGKRYEKTIAEIYGRVLRARTVVEDVSGIHGPLRTPEVRVLWGNGTETVHTEGGVQYALDVAQVMFSTGNLAERTGIANRVRPGDVVVDLFAGIGYFSVPIAVRSRPEAVYACEVNPVSFHYLRKNIRLNRADRIVPLFGNCRDVAPVGTADWVLMGHFDARDFLDVAFRCLRGTGTIVYHELCPNEQFPDALIRRISTAARASWTRVIATRTRIVKSYAPGIVHAVAESKVEPQMRGTHRRSDA